MACLFFWLATIVLSKQMYRVSLTRKAAPPPKSLSALFGLKPDDSRTRQEALLLNVALTGWYTFSQNKQRGWRNPRYCASQDCIFFLILTVCEGGNGGGTEYLFSLKLTRLVELIKATAPTTHDIRERSNKACDTQGWSTSCYVWFSCVYRSERGTLFQCYSGLGYKRTLCMILILLSK